jgi:hypothetical protein
MLLGARKSYSRGDAQIRASVHTDQETLTREDFFLEMYLIECRTSLQQIAMSAGREVSS